MKYLTIEQQDKIVEEIRSAVKRADDFGDLHGHDARNNHLIGGLSIVLEDIDPRIGDILYTPKSLRT